jgi:tripartite-type tricarboxylate transporter receptor subunit TctC
MGGKDMRRQGIATTVFWAGVVALSLLSSATAQTDWPRKPVKLVVGLTAGSATDVTARLFAQKFSEAWGQAVVVENIPGNAGAIGVDRVAKAAPDGYTLIFSGNAALTILPSLQTLPFDPLRDFAPISTVLTMPSVFVVNNDLPIKSIADLIAYAKANPGKLSFGTPGIGSPQHMAGALLCRLAGIEMEQIPYRGANFTDVMSGVVPVGIQGSGVAMPMIRDGRVRGLGITSLKRSASAPDLPTMIESGFPGFEVTTWYALLAPAGTPQPIIDKVRAESLKVLADPEMKSKFAGMGLDIVGSTPAETQASIVDDIPKWSRIIKEAGIKPSK